MSTVRRESENKRRQNTEPWKHRAKQIQNDEDAVGEQREVAKGYETITG